MAGEFLKTLRGVAQLANRELGPEAYAVYDRLVAEAYGEERAVRALEAWMRTSRRAGMPTVGDLVAILDPKADPKEHGASLSGRIMGLISEKGYVWPQTFRYDGYESFEDALRDELGDDSPAIVERLGGWVRVCQQYGGEGFGTNRAQLRDTIAAFSAAHARREALGAGKTLAELPESFTDPEDGDLETEPNEDSDAEDF